MFLLGPNLMKFSSMVLNWTNYSVLWQPAFLSNAIGRIQRSRFFRVQKWHAQKAYRNFVKEVSRLISCAQVRLFILSEDIHLENPFFRRDCSSCSGEVARSSVDPGFHNCVSRWGVWCIWTERMRDFGKNLLRTFFAELRSAKENWRKKHWIWRQITLVSWPRSPGLKRQWLMSSFRCTRDGSYPVKKPTLRYFYFSSLKGASFYTLLGDLVQRCRNTEPSLGWSLIAR